MNGKARQGMTWQGKARHGMERKKHFIGWKEIL
jgi:hypothetical protein